MKKETASVAIRVYPSTRRRIKVEAAKKNSSIAKVVEDRFSKGTPHPL